MEAGRPSHSTGMTAEFIGGSAPATSVNWAGNIKTQVPEKPRNGLQREAVLLSTHKSVMWGQLSNFQVSCSGTY